MNDDQELDDDFPMFKHSRYYTHDTFLDHINLQNDCFSILSLNIQSIHAKFDKMVLFYELWNKVTLNLVQFVYKKLVMQIYPYWNLKIIHVFLKVNNAAPMEVWLL